MSNYYKREDALGNAGAYIVSGKPFAVNLSLPADVTTATKIEFPSVTRWVQVSNCDSSGDTMRVAFSEAGIVSTSNYIVVSALSLIHLEVKVTEIYVAGEGAINNACSVVAGLTTIPTGSIIDNWSGSVGV
tara:strand:+ start:4429 stop:4821 length:393 start_codon:yes stop_codon:yes gene_type:complete